MPAPRKPLTWVAPLSCVTETDIRATGPSWLPAPEAGTGVISCAS